MQVLIISEKPSLGRTIAGALLRNAKSDKLHISGTLPDGSDCVVTWARGHLLTLASPKEHDASLEKWDLSTVPFLPKAFIDAPIKEAANKKYPGSVTAQEVLAHIVKLIKQLPKSGEVINACDAGREGDLIFTKILKYSRVPVEKVSRLWIQSTLPDAIKEAWQSRKPAASYAGLTQSAYTRDRSDWLWGMNLTRITTLKLGKRKQVLPVGRVQTPTLALLVRRDTQRRNFVPANYYTLLAEFPSGIGELDMTRLTKSVTDLVNFYGKGPDYASDIKAWWDPQKADFFASKAKTAIPYTVSDTTKTETSKPPMPFDLPSLQTDCNKTFGWTAANTLKYLQALYDQAYVTYPRTDCKYFPEDMFQKIYHISHDILSYIPEFSGQTPIVIPSKAPNCFNSSRVTDHFAIIPTGKFQGITLLAEREPQLYKLYLHISRRLLQALDAPAEFSVTTRSWVSDKDKNIRFVQTAKRISKAGWRRWSDKDWKDDAPLAQLRKNSENPISVTTVSHVTKCPPAYSEGALITAMETVGCNMNPELLQDMSESDAEKLLKNKGIGTAATRHEVIEKLIASEYVMRDKKLLIPTELGRMLIEKLDGVDPLITAPEHTAIWEQQLADMERGKGSFRDFILALFNELKRIKAVVMEKMPTNMDSGDYTSKLQPCSELCPISGKPLLVGEKLYISPAFPHIPLWKSLCGRLMTARDWSEILWANHKNERRVTSGFSGKYGDYSGHVVIDTENNKVVVLPVQARQPYSGRR